MRAIVIIPARYGSVRLSGKPLLHFAGRTLIEHTWLAAIGTGLNVWVATDDERIRADCLRFGASVVMTGECSNGTERCAEAAEHLGHIGPVVNWQGDSPLVPASWIPALLEPLGRGDAWVTTPVQRCSVQQGDLIRTDYLRGDPGATTVAIDDRFDALYFSKAPIPSSGPFWLHVGIYAYAREALAQYGRELGRLEMSEKLEQLRFLERGLNVRCVPVDGPHVWEVNNFHDIRIVERMMEERRAVVRS